MYNWWLNNVIQKFVLEYKAWKRMIKTVTKHQSQGLGQVNVLTQTNLIRIVTEVFLGFSFQKTAHEQTRESIKYKGLFFNKHL